MSQTTQPTTQDLNDYYNECRFEIVRLPEPDDPANQYLVHRINVASGETVETTRQADPGSEIEAYRLAESTTLEERFEIYAEEEAEERAAHLGVGA